MELLEKSDEISRYIRECYRIIHSKGHDIAKEYGLTYDQYHILLVLKKNIEDPPSIRDLSKRFQKAQNTTSEKITRLEDKGLVEKIADPQDRRIMRVMIRKEGLEIIENIKKERTERVTYRAVEDMGQERIDSFLKDLEYVYNNLKEEL